MSSDTTETPATTASARRPTIEVLAHGPYEVTGDLPLTRREPVRSAEGEPMTWRTTEETPTAGTYYLCRCGQSGTKPFCDGSHAFELFDGTETASTSDDPPEVEVHEGAGIDVVKRGERCIHASFCANARTNWFEIVTGTEDTSSRTQLIAMIEHCPSGALEFVIDGELVEPHLPQSVSAVEDGPLFVSGGVPLERADGRPAVPQNRMTLCRCGASSNKPLCDGTHVEIGFRG